MQRFAYNDGGAIIPMFASVIEAASNKLKYENYASIWELDGLKLPEKC